MRDQLEQSIDNHRKANGLKTSTGAMSHNLRPRRAFPLSAYSLSLPALLLMVFLYFLPAGGVIAIAFTDWQFAATSLSFVGLANFETIISDPTARASLSNTLVYVAIVLPGTVVGGLAVALLIESGRTLRGFYRAAHFIPFMATLSAMAIVWEAMLHPSLGLVNHVAAAIGLPIINWLADDRTALPVLALIGIWQNLGYSMVLFMAGLKAIPQELYDAAAIDGADAWGDRLATVTLPMLGPVTMFVVIVVSLKAFEVFDTVQILTQGGPGHASEVLLLTLYRESFEYLRTGYGAAVAVVFLIIVLAITLVQTFFIDKRVHYQ